MPIINYYFPTIHNDDDDEWTKNTHLEMFGMFNIFNSEDVPAPPERPLITYFTSRQVNLSWAHLQDGRNDPVVDFIIQIR